ncbi:MAG: glycosyltransferase family 2 protein [Treponema sp.]|nr:glycosyltransferase family 2 protein [Treponema sp.]
MNFLICIPTYNEVENIERLMFTLFKYLPPSEHHHFSVLIIDDNSPDGTANIVENLIKKYPDRLYILKRPEKQGLGKAYLAAFDWGLSRGYDIFLEMDADFSHNPKYIPEMVKHIQNYDVVIGSRNIKGGDVEGWSFLRNCISKGGSLYSRIVLRCSVKDLTGGFNMWTKNALLKIGLDRIMSEGYLFQIEMKYRAWRADCSIKEIPILFADRKAGLSKMSKKILFEALIKIWKIKKSVGDTAIDQFIKFGMTGGLGTITNLLLFFTFADKISLPEIPISIVCFIIAGTQNYIINHKWTFLTNTVNSRLSVKKWLAFLSGSLVGLIVNIVVMQLMIINLDLPFKFIAQACGIAAGMLINFFFSKFIVFKNKRTDG